ncbi:3-beta hydroxysteroid dehydrogenase/isomerase [Mycena vitilis]|nr:3-beta hydroxysteroid dehydrogenase/isomerase [Mycena vitilis]
MASPSTPTHESYLVIGGGTSFGETIVEELIRRGERRVIIFDAQPLAAAQAAHFGADVRVCVGDMLEPESIAEAVNKCATTCIIHSGMVSTPASAVARYPTGPQLPFSLAADKQQEQELISLHRKINTEGTRNVLSAALGSGSATVTQLVYVGNPDILFDVRDRPMLREVDAPYPAKVCDEDLEPQSHGEHMERSFNGVNLLRTAVIRPAMLFGPGYGLLSILRQIQGTPRIAGFQVGDNSNLVDRTYVSNAAHAAILAADRLNPAHPQHHATAGNAFFIAHGDPRPFWDFLRSVWVATGAVLPAPTVLSKEAMFFFASLQDVVGRLRGGKEEARKNASFLCANRTYDISKSSTGGARLHASGFIR